MVFFDFTKKGGLGKAFSSKGLIGKAFTKHGAVSKAFQKGGVVESIGKEVGRVVHAGDSAIIDTLGKAQDITSFLSNPLVMVGAGIAGLIIFSTIMSKQ